MLAFAAYAALTALLTLNRETGGILVALYLATRPTLNWGTVTRFLILLGIWVSVQLGLHLTLGSAPHVLGLLGTLQYNLAIWQNGLYENLILLPLFILVVRGYRSAPTLYRRLAWVAGLYGLAIIIAGAWDESQRLLLPITPLLLPLILWTETEL